jgi:hypothetical protein
VEFFIPGAKDEEQAEDVLRAIRERVQANSNQTLGDARIFRLDYVHDGRGRGW